MLYLRKLGTQELIGQLFAVDKKTISNAIADVAPLPDQHASRPAAPPLD